MSENVPIFLSYADADEGWVRQVKQALSAYRIDWFDAPLLLGETWPEKLEEALNRSRYVVFMITPEAAQSSRMALELGAALALKKEVIPVVFPGTPSDGIPGPIKLRKWIEKREPKAVAADVARRIAA